VASPVWLPRHTRLLYRFEYSSSSLTNPGVLLGKPEAAGRSTTIQSSLTANLAIGVGDQVTFLFEAPHVVFQVNGQEAPTQANEIARGLSTVAVVSVRADGKIESVRFAEGLSHLTRTYAQTLLSMIQFVASDPEAQDWESAEEDPNGTYAAKYKRISADPLRYRKSKQEYVRSTPPGEATPQIITSGSFDFEFSQGSLRSINGTEEQMVKIAGRNLATGKSSLTMTRVSRHRMGQGDLAKLNETIREAARREAVSLSARDWEKAAREARYRQTLGSATLPELLEDLRKLEASQEAGAEVALQRKFEALISLHPEAVAPLGKLLLDAGVRTSTMRVVSGALNAAGSPEAQSALAKAIRARAKDRPALSRLLYALATVSDPTPEADGVAFELTRSADVPIAQEAELALGIMARNLANRAPERADAMVRTLIEMLQSDRTPAGSTQLLLVLGNSGSPLGLSIIRHFAGDPSPQLRASAAAALRFIPAAEAEELLIHLLAADLAGEVRKQAAEALSERAPTARSVMTMEERIRADGDEDVRLEILRGLWRGVDRFPEIRAVIEAVARDDSSDDVRKVATRLLNP
jgi:hypothetical protein